MHSVITYFALFLFPLALFQSHCSGGGKPAAPKPTVQTRTVKRRNLTRRLEKGASVAYLEKAAVSAPFAGTLERILVHPGDRVKKGEPVAQLDTIEMELSLKQSRAREHSARAQWKLAQSVHRQSTRQSEKELESLKSARARTIRARSGFLRARQDLKHKQEMYRLGGISRMEMEEAYNQYISQVTHYYETLQNLRNQRIGYRKKDLEQTTENLPRTASNQKQALIRMNTDPEKKKVRSAYQELLAARSGRQKVQRMLREATIRSPIHGVVATRNKEPGEEVQAGKPFLSIVRMDKLLIQSSVSELNRPYIHAGQIATVTIDVYPDVEFEGTVHRIAPIADPETRSFQIGVLIHNDDQNPLSPGMFAEIEIETHKSRDTLSLPCSVFEGRESLEGNKQEIFLLRKGHVYRQSILVGKTFGKRCEVKSGLDEGDVVVISNTAILRDGMPVRDTSLVE